jgi:ribonuclease VapC
VVLETSAVIALLRVESDAPALAGAIERDPVRLISTVSALEASIVIEGRAGELGVRDLDLLLYRTGAKLVAFNAEHLEAARSAYRRFGKGRHPAALNFGDCCSYALAAVSGEPLLAKGCDFSKTDIRLVKIEPTGGD